MGVTLLPEIQRCFREERAFYTKHARREMRVEEYGPISDREVAEVIANGEMIEIYPNSEPYPSVLLYGVTGQGRPLHVVAAYSAEEDTCIVITVYQPDPERWTELRWRQS